jgi:translation initiation factor IF-3
MTDIKLIFAQDQNRNSDGIGDNKGSLLKKFFVFTSSHIKKKKKHNEALNRTEDHEIRVSPTIQDHDLNIKAKKVKEFLDENCKVKIQVKLEGRERYIPNIVEDTAKRLAAMLVNCSRMEYAGGQYVLIPHKQP